MAVSAWLSEAVAVRPSGPLRQYVREYHGYRQRGVTPAQHLGMPSPYLTVIFTLDEPLEVVRHADPLHGPGVYSAMIGGLHSSPALVRHDGAQSGIQLQMSPLAARPLTGLPAGELASLDAQAEEILGPLATQVYERVRAAEDWPARFAVLDRLLGEAVDADRAVPAEVARAWGLLLRSGGTRPIRDVARDVGWSERHLSAQFTREIGLRPKMAARVIRFHRARHVLQHNVGAPERCWRRGRVRLLRPGASGPRLAAVHRPGADGIAHEFRNFQVAGVEDPTSLLA